MGYVDNKDGTIYADLTGNSPITSMYGMQVVFIMYNWMTTKILATPINDAKDETIV